MFRKMKMKGRLTSILGFLILSLSSDYSYIDGIETKEKKLRIGQTLTNDESSYKLVRRTFKIPGTNTTINMCVSDSNCKEGQICRNLSCVSGENGESCNYDEDCKSHVCLATVILGKCVIGTVCHPGLPDGQNCCRNNDCLSKKCTSLLKCGFRKTGEFCKKNEDCDSDICNKTFKCSNVTTL